MMAGWESFGHENDGDGCADALWMGRAGRGVEGLRLSVLRVREREVESAAKASLGRSAVTVMKQIANAGKSLGSPWTQDHKKAALAAWMALHGEKGGTLTP